MMMMIVTTSYCLDLSRPKIVAYYDCCVLVFTKLCTHEYLVISVEDVVTQV